MSDVFRCFPDVELINYLELFCDCSVSPELLKAPTSGFMKAILQAFLKGCLLNVDAMEVMPWNEGDCMVEHKELYDDTSIFIFFTIAKRFMITAGILDFSIKDILDPKPKRTRKILTHLIPLWKHNLTMLKKYEDIEFNLQQEIKDEKKLLDVHEALKDKYVRLLESKVDPEAKRELLNMKCSEKLDEIRRAKDAISNQYQVLKTDIATEQKRNSELDVNIISEKEKIAELNSRILKSPNRLTSDMDELKRKIGEDDEKILEMSKKKEQKKQELVSLQNCMDNFSKSSEISKELFESVETLRKEATAVDAKQQIIEELSEKMKVLNSNLNEVSEKMTLFEQKWAQAELQVKMQIEGQKKILEVNKRSSEKELSMTKTLENKAIEMQQAIKTLQKKFENLELSVKNVKSETSEQLERKKRDFEECIQSFIHDVELTTDIIKKLDL